MCRRIRTILRMRPADTPLREGYNYPCGFVYNFQVCEAKKLSLRMLVFLKDRTNDGSGEFRTTEVQQ